MSDQRPSKSESKYTDEDSASALASAEKDVFASEAGLAAAKEAEYVSVKAAVFAADAVLASAASVLAIFDGMQPAAESAEMFAAAKKEAADMLAAAKKQAAVSEAALVSAEKHLASSKAIVRSAEKNATASIAAFVSFKNAAVNSMGQLPELASPASAVIMPAAHCGMNFHKDDIGTLAVEAKAELEGAIAAVVGAKAEVKAAQASTAERDAAITAVMEAIAAAQQVLSHKSRSRKSGQRK